MPNFSFFGSMRKAAFIYFLLAFSLYSCVKPPSYSNTPQIQFVSVSQPIIANGLSDTLTFSFTDGDGDIGVPSIAPQDTVTNCSDSLCALKNGDSACLHQANFDVFLIDGRSNCLECFASANVQPSGKYKAISGTIQVVEGVYNLQCPQCSCKTTDSVVYSIILRDMAGHFSNVIKTTPIAIVCP